MPKDPRGVVLLYGGQNEDRKRKVSSRAESIIDDRAFNG